MCKLCLHYCHHEFNECLVKLGTINGQLRLLYSNRRTTHIDKIIIFIFVLIVT